MVSTVLYSTQRLYACMIQHEIKKSQSKIIRLAIGPLVFVSLFRFMLKETDIADSIFFVILQIDPIWFEDSFIEININLSKRNFYNATSDKMLRE